MERDELSLCVGLILSGSPPCPMPVHDQMRQEDAVRWTKIRMANRADVVIPYVSRPQWALLSQVA